MDQIIRNNNIAEQCIPQGIKLRVIFYKFAGNAQKTDTVFRQHTVLLLHIARLHNRQRKKGCTSGLILFQKGDGMPCCFLIHGHDMIQRTAKRIGNCCFIIHQRFKQLRYHAQNSIQTGIQYGFYCLLMVKRLLCQIFQYRPAVFQTVQNRGCLRILLRAVGYIMLQPGRCLLLQSNIRFQIF